MPLPLSDISQAYRSAPERTEQALTKVGDRAAGKVTATFLFHVSEEQKVQISEENVVFVCC